MAAKKGITQHCDKCNLDIGTYAFKRHYNTCSGIKNVKNIIYERISIDKAKCPKCDKIFGINGVQTHYRMVHSGWINPHPGNKGKIMNLLEKENISKKMKEYYKKNPPKRKDGSLYKNYKVQARFNFDLKNFPEEFDFKLLEQVGMYKATNRGNNLNGVSRDHMVSIKFGFDHKIPVEIISHPANCKLLLQSDNVSKKAKCSISMEELYERIKIWNEKYGE